MTRGWAEKQRLGDLPAYAKAEGSDIQQFASFDEEAQMLIEGGETAKMRPAENSRWFAQTAADINAQVAEAEKRIGSRRNKEFDSTITDLKILANLALFHSRRIPAAVSYRLFERTKDPKALDDAIADERSAIEAWRQLVAAAGDFYADDLMMGVRGAGLCGHWKDELAALEKGLACAGAAAARLQAERAKPRPRRAIRRPPAPATMNAPDGDPPARHHGAGRQAADHHRRGPRSVRREVGPPALPQREPAPGLSHAADASDRREGPVPRRDPGRGHRPDVGPDVFHRGDGQQGERQDLSRPEPGDALRGRETASRIGNIPRANHTKDTIHETPRLPQRLSRTAAMAGLPASITRAAATDTRIPISPLRIAIGEPPVLLEGVRGIATLHRDGDCSVTALSPYGSRTTDVEPQKTIKGLTIRLDGQNKATYYEVRLRQFVNVQTRPPNWLNRNVAWCHHLIHLGPRRDQCLVGLSSRLGPTVSTAHPIP